MKEWAFEAYRLRMISSPPNGIPHYGLTNMNDSTPADQPEPDFPDIFVSSIILGVEPVSSSPSFYFYMGKLTWFTNWLLLVFWSLVCFPLTWLCSFSFPLIFLPFASGIRIQPEKTKAKKEQKTEGGNSRNYNDDDSELMLAFVLKYLLCSFVCLAVYLTF